MFFPRQSRGERLAGRCAAVSRWGCLFLEEVPRGSLPPCPQVPWHARAARLGWWVTAGCGQELGAGAGQGAGGGPSKPPAQALGEPDPADTCDGLEAQHHAAAGSLRPLARLASPSPSDSWEV